MASDGSDMEAVVRDRMDGTCHRSRGHQAVRGGVEARQGTCLTLIYDRF